MDGVVYLVDAIDRGRFPDAKKELDSLLTSEELQDVPFLVLGNKIDMPTAASEEELKYALGLMDTYGKDKGPTERWPRRPPPAVEPVASRWRAASAAAAWRP